MTLIELLVATALGVLLIGIIVFVWMQSNRIFSATVLRLETYQRLRTVLDTMERDLANTSRTFDLEFYEDAPVGPDGGNGHYDLADSVVEVTDPGTGALQHFRVPRDELDPLRGGEEFGLPGFPGDVRYIFAPTILSPPPYEIGAGYTENRFYWRDEVYVRSFALIDGVNRPAIIHYRLVPAADGRSGLRRRIWWLNDEGEFVPHGTTTEAPTEQTSILTQGVADLKIGFYLKFSTLQADGHWYHVGDPGGTFEDPSGLGRGEALLKADEDRGFRSGRVQISPKLENQFKNVSGAEYLNAISFVYEGTARLEQTSSEPALLRTLTDTAGTLSGMKLQDEADLAHYTNFDFPCVRPGDKFLIYDATDDDDHQALTADVEAGPLFEPRLFTVDQINTDPHPTKSGVYFASVKFREPIDFYRLKSAWLGPEPEFEVTQTQVDGAYEDAGPGKRTISGSFNVRYRVGFLPAAFIVRLSCDDTYNRKILPMERVIRLVQQ